jgi:hypothetical protein
VDAFERFLDFFQLVGLDDRFNFLHGLILSSNRVNSKKETVRLNRTVSEKVWPKTKQSRLGASPLNPQRARGHPWDISKPPAHFVLRGVT